MLIFAIIYLNSPQQKNHMSPNYEHTTPQDLSAPIPETPPLAGWKEIPFTVTDKSHEPLVGVGIFSDHPKVLTSSVYANEHHNSPYLGGLKGSNVAIFMRKGVAEKLDKAADLIPKGTHLMVMDAYRSLEVQSALFEQYRSGVVERHPEWSNDEVSAETQKYVSIPSTDKSRPSPHNTGASVDVVIVQVNDEIQNQIDSIDEMLNSPAITWQDEYSLTMKRSEIIRRNAKMLDFGTRFDHGGPAAALRHLENEAVNRDLTENEQVQLSNRRLLFNVMAASGLEPYADEWWHFNDPASQMGAKVAGIDHAEYGAIELSAENRKFAQMREQHHVNSVRIARGEDWTPPKGLELHYKLARAAGLADNPKNVWRMLDTVDKIEPPESNKVA
jgi:zinc D-Ala-D-Ala dipeptidase